MCPGLIVVPSRPKVYVEYQHRILDAIEGCIPIEHVISINEVACVLDRSQQMAEAAAKLSTEIKQAIRSQVGECLTISVGWQATSFSAVSRSSPIQITTSQARRYWVLRLLT